MIKGDFFINGFDGIQEFNSRLITYPNIPKPKRKGSMQSLPNASRDVFSQSKSYFNREFELEIGMLPKDHNDYIVYDSTLFKTFSSDDYQKFVYYGEPEMTYFVKMMDVVETQRIARMSEATSYKFKMTAGAFKYIDYENVIYIKGDTTIYNPTAYSALPYMKIIGNGDVTLTINGRDYEFKDIKDYIECDSDELQQMVYKDNQLMNEHFLSNDLPYLDPIDNEIKLTGNAKIELKPRWRTI